MNDLDLLKTVPFLPDPPLEDIRTKLVEQQDEKGEKAEWFYFLNFIHHVKEVE